jgi:lysophospholipase L1-like esterase
MAFELEANDPDVLDAAREDELLRGAPWKRVAVVGDSLAEAELVDPAEGYERITWPERVVRALRRQREGVELLNLGKRDLTSWQVADEQLTPAIEFAPDLTFVLCGGNDVLASRFSPESTTETMARIVSALTASGSDVVLITTFDTGPLPIPEPFRSRITERMPVLHTALKEVAAAYDGVTLVDLSSHPRGRDKGVFGADGIHTNDIGQAVIASAVVSVLPDAMKNA